MHGRTKLPRQFVIFLFCTNRRKMLPCAREVYVTRRAMYPPRERDGDHDMLLRLFHSGSCNDGFVTAACPSRPVATDHQDEEALIQLGQSLHSSHDAALEMRLARTLLAQNMHTAHYVFTDVCAQEEEEGMPRRSTFLSRWRRERTLGRPGFAYKLARLLRMYASGTLASAVKEKVHLRAGDGATRARVIHDYSDMLPLLVPARSYEARDPTATEKSDPSAARERICARVARAARVLAVALPVHGVPPAHGIPILREADDERAAWVALYAFAALCGDSVDPVLPARGHVKHLL